MIFLKNAYAIFVNSEIKKWKRYCHFQKRYFLETIEDSNSDQTMQAFNQSVLDSVKIRDLKNVHYESYQDSDVLQDENDMKICDEEKKEKEDENENKNENENENEELEYIAEEEIDSKIWRLKNESEKEEEKNENENKNDDDDDDEIE